MIITNISLEEGSINTIVEFRRLIIFKSVIHIESIHNLHKIERIEREYLLESL